MFAAVRAAYNIPRDENLKLREFPTLAHVIGSRATEPGVAKAPAGSTGVNEPERREAASICMSPAKPLAIARPAARQLRRRQSHSAPRPVAHLAPAAGHLQANWCDARPGRRVVIMPDKGWSSRRLGPTTCRPWASKSLRIEAHLMRTRLPIASRTGWPPARYTECTGSPHLDNEGELSAMDLATGMKRCDVRVKSLYTTMRVLYEQVATPGTFLVSATRLGGQHGYDDAGALAPLGGAVTGFTKTYKRERMDALVKAVDFEAGAQAVRSRRAS